MPRRSFVLATITSCVVAVTLAGWGFANYQSADLPTLNLGPKRQSYSLRIDLPPTKPIPPPAPTTQAAAVTVETAPGNRESLAATKADDDTDVPDPAKDLKLERTVRVASEGKSKDRLKPAGEERLGEILDVSGGVQLRAAPGLSGKRISIVSGQDIVIVIGRGADRWLKVRTGDGETGFMHARFVRIGSDGERRAKKTAQDLR